MNLLSDNQFPTHHLEADEGFDSQTIEADPCGTKAVVSASDADQAPFRMVCCITGLPRGGTSATLGSGTLLSDDCVLTAAHTVVNPRTGIVAPAARLRVSPGRGRSGTGISPVTDVRVNPAWLTLKRAELATRARGRKPPPGTDVALAAQDFAVLKLQRPLGATFGFWGETPRRRDDDRGSSVGALAGWRPGRYCMNHSGFPKSAGCRQTHHWSETVASRDARFVFVDAAVSRGESGGPAWVTRSRSNGGRHLFGIVIFGIGTRPDQPSSLAFVRLINDTSIRSFIATNVR